MPDLLEELVGDVRRCRSVVLRPAAPHLERDEHVLARGQAAERLEPLERARDAEARPLEGPLAGDVAPSSTTWPGVGVCRPVMTLNSVVLPAPFGPMSPVIAARLDLERARCRPP